MNVREMNVLSRGIKILCHCETLIILALDSATHFQSDFPG